MAQSGYIQEIYNSRNNLLKYLEYQGYSVDEYAMFSINEIYAMFQNKQLDMLVERKTNPETGVSGKKTYIKYHLAKTLRPNVIYDYLEDLFNLENVLTKKDDLIIVTKDEPNDTIIKELKQIWATEGQFVIIWHIKHLQFNILEHTLVPKHRVLTLSQDTEIRKRYNISNNSELPDISRFDPVAMAIGIRPGQICEITRPSKTSIVSNFYRICSE